MSTIRNYPAQETSLLLAARKSFSLTVALRDKLDQVIPLVDTTATLTVGGAGASTETKLVKTPAMQNDDLGVFRFDLQAAELDWPADEYPYEIVLNASGFSSITVSGVIDLVESVDFGSAGSFYADPASTGLLRLLLSRNSIVVRSDTLPIPGVPGEPGRDGVDVDPFGEVLITYDGSGRISSLNEAGVLTEYTYNPDGSIATDSRNGVTRTYGYESGRLTTITPG